jgi:hypothetical protein
MAKRSMIERQKKRQALVEKYAAKRAELKTIAANQDLPMEERFKARLKLAKLPRNSSPTRLNNRCEVTGRSPRLLPQAPHEPHRAPGLCLQGADPGHGQVELVREGMR